MIFSDVETAVEDKHGDIVLTTADSALDSSDITDIAASNTTDTTTEKSQFNEVSLQVADAGCIQIVYGQCNYCYNRAPCLYTVSDHIIIPYPVMKL